MGKLYSGMLCGFSILLSANVAVASTLTSSPVAVSVRAKTTAKAYSTNFDFNGTEKPLSEGSIWTNGFTTGLDWMDVQKVSGLAYATGINNGYDDSVAHLSGFANNHFAQATVHAVNGYSPGGSHEVELLLRFKITAHNARGYEICLGWNGAYAQIVRWNGPLNDFTYINTAGPGPGALVDGDVVKATAVGSTITVYKNGVSVLSATDSAWSDGNPGVGFFVRPSSTAVFANYSFTSFAAGDL